MKPEKFFIGQDESGHNYVVRATKRREFERWVSSGEDDVPEFATMICKSLPFVVFENWDYA
jgi:hypothetical protein